ncbi:Proton/sodium-glutamate symport protein [compost metagenome]
MDMARTALNVIGNALAALVIARWEGMYDAAKGEQYYNSLMANAGKPQAAAVGEAAKR